MPNQGDRYVNKIYFDLNKDWTLASIMEKLQGMGLTVAEPQISYGQFLQKQSRGDISLVFYTHRTRDTATVLRRAFVVQNEMEWYTSRGWVEAEGGKLEIPY